MNSFENEIKNPSCDNESWDWNYSGFCEEELHKDLKRVEKRTNVLNTNGLKIYSYSGRTKEGKEILYQFCQGINFDDLYNSSVMATKQSKSLKNILNKEEIAMLKRSGYFFVYEGRIIIPSKTFSSLFYKRIGAGNLPSKDPIKALYLAHLMQDNDNVIIITRKLSNTCHKAIGAFSSKFVYRSINDLVNEFIKEIRKIYTDAVVYQYNLSDEKFEIRLKIGEEFEFFDEKLFPSLILKLSETGESVSLQSYMQVKGKKGIYVDDKVKQQHQINFDVAKQVQVFAQKESLESVVDNLKSTKNVLLTKEQIHNIGKSLNLEACMGIKLYRNFYEGLEPMNTKNFVLYLLNFTSIIESEDLVKNTDSRFLTIEETLTKLWSSPIVKGVLEWK